MNNNMRENILGIGLMIIAMLGFSLEDGSIKALSADLSAGQILILLGTGGTIVFALATFIFGQRFTLHDIMHPDVMIRTLGELLGTAGFILAITLADLSVVSAIIQVNPLLVTMGAALFLGEKVGTRRWAAIIFGMFGVMIILRPGAADFNPAYLIAVFGVIFLSVRDVVTRRIPKSIPSLVMATMGFASIIPAGILMMLFEGQSWAPIIGWNWGIIILGIIFGVSGYFCLIQATRIGEMSAITPFRYSRLIFGSFVGIFIFGETTDIWVWLGSAIIITSGLYAFWREIQLK